MKKIILMMISLLLFSGCTFFSELKNTESVTLILPSWPPCEYGVSADFFPELDYWNIEIHSVAINENRKIENGTSSFDIIVKKNSPVSVEATPVFVSSDSQHNFIFFKPAGSIYPYYYEGTSINKGTLILEWEKGFVAYLMNRIYLTSKETELSLADTEDFIEKINWKKIQETLDGKENVNPWYFDDSLILSNLSYRNFKANYLSATNVVEIDVKTISDNQTPDFLSSYIPENKFINERNCILIPKNTYQIFYRKDGHALNICYESAKKCSVEIIYLPIYIKEL